MKSYVVGFVFDKSLERVMLIEKTHPEWQKGKLNGIGGAVEHTDKSTSHSMVRECEEESSLIIYNWTKIAIVKCPSFDLYFFRSTIDLDRLLTAKSSNDEAIRIFRLDNLLKPNNFSRIVRPSSWLLLMAADLDAINTSYIFYKVDQT